MNTHHVGHEGEEAAARWLRDKGWQVLLQNYHIRTAEIDVIALDPSGILCFVEVKTRKNDAFGMPCEAVTYAKQQKIISAARHYLAYHEPEGEVRFDVLEVYGDMRKGQFCAREFRLIPNAFDGSMQ